MRELDLDLFVAVVHRRAAEWASSGIAWRVHHGPTGYGKCSAWVACETDQGLGQLTVWDSGEAELEVGYFDRTETRSIHYDLTTLADLDEWLAALTRWLTAAPPLEQR